MDIILELSNVYDSLDNELTIEKLIALKPKIKEIANECRQRNIFTQGKSKFDEFILEIDSIEDKNLRLTAAWNYMDDRLNNAPGDVFLLGTAVLTIPIVDHVLDSF